MIPTQKKSGILFVIATPIGNLEDITLRALRTLKEVSLIAAEDTRHTKNLLNHYQITNNLVSCYRENETSRSAAIIEELLLGHDVALVSDAGTPCISDPGSTLIAKAHEAGVIIVPLPGPSALTAALSMSGMQYQNFLFVGFLPNSKADRRRRLGSLKDNASVMVFYESPRRILSCLDDISRVLGNRDVFVVRELTKIHEEYFRGEINEVLSSLKQKPSIKGEFVLIIEGGLVSETPDSDDIDELIQWYRDEGQNTLSYSVKKISNDLGISKAKVYQRALQIWEIKDREGQ